MIQDGQDAPAPPGTGTTPSCLQVVLLAFDKNAEREAAKDRYTLIRFPQTYEEATAAIDRNLGAHMPGGKAGSMNIFSRMLNDDNEWIWAKADREDWDLVREQLLVTGKALGIGRAATPPFIRGPVGLAYRESGSTKWSLIASTIQIQRPGSYREARDLISRSLRFEAFRWPQAIKCLLLYRKPNPIYVDTAHFLAHLQFKFCYFLADPNQPDKGSTARWVEFPENAEVDEGVWRAFVPEAYEVLGFSVSERK